MINLAKRKVTIMSEITRGTTHEIEFVLDADLTEVADLWVTFSQYGLERFTKHAEDIELIDENTIKVYLTEEDTLLLKSKEPLSIQIKLLWDDGSVEATEIIRGKVGEILNENIMGVEPIPDGGGR